MEGVKNPVDDIASTTKSAFTRAYNKCGHLLPYDTAGGTKKSKKGAGSAADEEATLEGEWNGAGRGGGKKSQNQTKRKEEQQQRALLKTVSSGLNRSPFVVFFSSS